MLIHEMLEETTKRYPQNIAVKHGDETITFEKLNEQSTKLGTFFCSKGVKEGDRIALVTEKSIEAVVSIFAILKSGAMYVPIDPTTPKERLEYILKDCGVNMIVVSPDSFAHYVCAAPYDIVKIPFLDKNTDLFFTDDFECLSEPKKESDIEIEKDASAYIIYTSGSTGEPKGVEIYHHSVTNLMKWYTKEFNITHRDNILSFVPFWFDASICDLFSMAKTGATLVLPPGGINIFPSEFAKFLVDEQISLFFAPSSQFVLALDALKVLKYPHLKTVMFGAEELAVKYVRELQEVFNGCDLVNIYGPTECTDIVTFYRVANIINTVPIGKPYSDIGAFVFKEGEIVKRGEIGELIIYGPNLMKGYWNKPEENDKVLKYHRTIPNDDFVRVYLTGDIVYKNEEGDYVYVGRKDRQIKSMGRRIQLEEIESLLNEHPLIKEVVIRSVQDVNVESRTNIECHIVPLTTLIEGEIIRYCRTRLPDYMVPAKVCICDALPKTSNGKQNKRELK